VRLLSTFCTTPVETAARAARAPLRLNCTSLTEVRARARVRVRTRVRVRISY
jgi:hypothetical protein